MSNRNLQLLALALILLGALTYFVCKRKRATENATMNVSMTASFDDVLASVRQRSDEIRKYLEENSAENAIVAKETQKSAPVYPENTPEQKAIAGLAKAIDQIAANDQVSDENELMNSDIFQKIETVEAFVRVHGLEDEKAAANQLYRLSEISTAHAIAAIDLAQEFEDASYLQGFFEVPRLPAEAKAHLIAASVDRSQQDGKVVLKKMAHDLLQAMLIRGSLVEAYAALSAVKFFPEMSDSQLASVHENFCRFQNESSDEIGFEMLRLRFNRVFKNKHTASSFWNCNG